MRHTQTRHGVCIQREAGQILAMFPLWAYPSKRETQQTGQHGEARRRTDWRRHLLKRRKEHGETKGTAMEGEEGVALTPSKKHGNHNRKSNFSNQVGGYLTVAGLQKQTRLILVLNPCSSVSLTNLARQADKKAPPLPPSSLFKGNQGKTEHPAEGPRRMLKFCPLGIRDMKNERKPDTARFSKMEVPRFEGRVRLHWLRL